MRSEWPGLGILQRPPTVLPTIPLFRLLLKIQPPIPTVQIAMHPTPLLLKLPVPIWREMAISIARQYSVVNRATTHRRSALADDHQATKSRQRRQNLSTNPLLPNCSRSPSLLRLQQEVERSGRLVGRLLLRPASGYLPFFDCVVCMIGGWIFVVHSKALVDGGTDSSCSTFAHYMEGCP